MKSKPLLKKCWILFVFSLVLMLAAPHLASAQTTAPETTLTSFPMMLGPSRLDASTFAFKSSIDGSTFECSLDGAAFAACSSPVNYASLSAGSHTFQVRAVAPDSTPDATPASHTWMVSSYEPWSREVLNYVANVYGDWAQTSAIALDASGVPHIVYATGGSVAYAHWVPATKSWEIEMVYQKPYDMGWDVSLALDGQGHPHITFWDQYGTGSAGLHYAAWDGSAWTTTLVDARPTGYDVYGQSNSLALDADGHPHIAYFNSDYDNSSPSGLWYAAFDGTSWTKEHVDATCSTCGSYGTSLALDASGYPRISYSSGSLSNRDLKYATWNGTGWDIQTVDTFGDIGCFPSLALDGAGTPHIAYASPTELDYAVWNQTTGAWDRQVAATGSFATSNAGTMQLALDASGRPHISFGKPSSLRYVFWDGQAWQNQAVGSPNQYGDGGSMALDASGWAHFSVDDTYSWEYFVREKALAGVLRATVVLSGASYPKDAQLEICLSGGTIGATPSCKTATGNGGMVEWSGLMPGSDYTVSAPDVADWAEPADQSGLSVSTGVTTDVNLTFTYTGSAEPDTTITGRPMFDRANSSDQASFQFESSQTDSTFECSLDGAAFAACTSPQVYGSLADGSHSFQVRARNARVAFDASPAAFDWTVDANASWQLAELVDGITASFPGHMVFDGAGFPRVVQSDPGHTWYMPWNGQTWDKTPLTEVWQPHVAVDADGRTHMVYAEAYLGGWEEYSGLRYAVLDESGWKIETIPGVGGNTALDFQLTADGQVHIAFLDTDANTVKYATRDEADWRGKAWKIEAVGSAFQIYRLSIALDAEGYPHLAWVDAFDDTARYVARSASGWGTVETIATLGDGWKEATSLAVGADGQPRVAYCDDFAVAGGSDLYYAVRDVSGWQPQLVHHSSGVTGCWYPSLALAADGHPLISSYDELLVGPQLHEWTESAWATETIEQFAGGYQSAADTFMILDTAGRPNVLYPVWAYGTGVPTEHKYVYARRGAEVPVESAPVVTTEPSDQTAQVGDAVSFSAAASGYPVPAVQWQVSTDGGNTWTDVAGADQTTYEFTASLDQDGNQYRAVFSNSEGSATSSAATLTVNKADATCTITGWSGPYDGSAHGASGTCTGVGGAELSGLDVGETFTEVPGGTAYWTFTDVSGNYGDQSGSVGIVIGKATASVVPDAAGKVYGDEDPALGGTLSGFVDTDGVSATYSRMAGESAGSSYTISAVLSPADVLSNYDITYNTAAFTITPRPIEVTADAKTKVVGDPDPELTYQVTSGSLAFSDAFSGALTREPGEEIGHYAILQGTLALNGNYDLTYVGEDLTITSANTAPVADPGGPYLGAVNTQIAFDGSSSSDPEGDDLTYDWDYGDDSSGATPSHSYAAAGIYNVCLTVNDGTVDSDSACTMAVVYDPSAGFVTGGGWIDSPAGAYKLDESLSGKATFGFVSKYKKGATVPEGNTEFQFQAGGFNFHSEAYEWLVVSKDKVTAQFKGSGTVNGALDPNGNAYRFMLWAGDGSPDTFRIRVWWEDADGVEHDVYDNGFDQEISGGSIVVHTGK